MAHLIDDRNPTSGSGPMDDLCGGGPLGNGSHLAHHPVSYVSRGVNTRS